MSQQRLEKLRHKMEAQGMEAMLVSKRENILLKILIINFFIISGNLRYIQQKSFIIYLYHLLRNYFN
jgi:hypothetical protein